MADDLLPTNRPNLNSRKSVKKENGGYGGKWILRRANHLVHQPGRDQRPFEVCVAFRLQLLQPLGVSYVHATKFAES